MSAALAFHDLTLGYDRHPAVHHLDGTVATGDVLAVIGPNGAGKSTLLKGAAGLLAPLGGRIERGARQRSAYLPQAADLDRSFPIDVFDVVAMGLAAGGGLFGAWGAPARAKITDALARVGLSGFERRGIGALSGGQLQRVLFARLLLQDADILLLDEPFAAVDSRTSGDLLAILAGWRREGRTIVAVLHDMELVKAFFPKTLLLAREKVAWGATADVLAEDNLRRARDMCEAFDHAAPACEAAA